MSKIKNELGRYLLNPTLWHKDVNAETIIDAVKRRDSCLDNPGFCLVCGCEADQCEPDATNYKCEECGERQVFGAEELLMYLA